MKMFHEVYVTLKQVVVVEVGHNEDEVDAENFAMESVKDSGATTAEAVGRFEDGDKASKAISRADKVIYDYRVG